MNDAHADKPAQPVGITAPEMLEIKAAHYLPPPGYGGTMQEMGLPPFTLRSVTMMLRDSHVKLGMSIKVSPLMHVKFEVTGRPDVAAFAQAQMKAAWDSIVPQITSALWYRVAIGEPIYRKNEQTRMMELAGIKPFHPTDCDFLELDNKLVGVRVKTRMSATNVAIGPVIDLYGMKSFIYIHGGEFGGREGRSELESCYQPWLEKHGPDGALGSRRLWHHKNAFHSGIMFHPPGTYEWTKADGTIGRTPYRDLARQAMERSANGAVFSFPQVFDERGNKLWEYHQPTMNGDGSALINYVEQLNTEMMRGMGIPDDIISQTSGTGSYAGRSIPFQAYLASQTHTVRAIFQAIVNQCVAPLCWWNFQSRDFEFHGVEVDRSKLLPTDQPEQGPGMAPPDMMGGGEAPMLDPNAPQLDPQQMQAAMAPPAQ